MSVLWRVRAGVVVPLAFFAAVLAFVWTQDPNRPTEADRAIVRANLVSKVPDGAQRIDAELGRPARIVLAAAQQDARGVLPGEETKVTLYWRSIVPLQGEWKVFAHLEGPDGPVQNLDHQPVYGLLPVNAMRPGPLVRDEIWIAFPPRAARGTYSLWVGVFSLSPPWDRLPVANAASVPVDLDGRLRAATWDIN